MSISSTVGPILKPSQIEGLVTLTAKQRTLKRINLFYKQRGICACGCNQRMTLTVGYLNTATLDHVTPNKAGCKKQDADFNLRVISFFCNSVKGSKRIPGKTLVASRAGQ